MKKIILSILMIILVCGCTLPDSLQSVMPGYTEQEVKELPPDILKIQSLSVIPTPPINSDDQFTVSFILENQDDKNLVDNVKYSLFDSGLCKFYTGDPKEQDLGTFSPLQKEFIEWTFKAPKNEEIARLSAKCPIRFKANYSFSSKSQIDVGVISNERLVQLQRSGESTTFVPTLSVGRGPIKIYISFGATLPVRASDPASGTKNKLPIYIAVENKGQGLYGEIPEGDLILKIPNDFTPDDCDKFTEATSADLTSADIEKADGYDYYKNIESISLIRKKTHQLRCSFSVTENVDFEKTFYFTAFLNYGYTITGETEVVIEPTA